MFRFSGRAIVFTIVLVVLAEVFFRTVVPATSLPGSYMAKGDEIFRFDTTWVTSGVNTHGRFGLRPATWKVNNAGWNSPYTYSPPQEKKRPRIAVLGDSFIEGFPVNLNQHVDVDLHRLANGRADVYSFGRSGWYMAQYVALARYIDKRFAPDTYLVFINQMDIHDSLREYGVKTPFAYQITQDGARFRELKPPAHYVFGRRSRLLRRSAIVRYVRGNLGVTWGQKDALIEDANLRPQNAASVQAEVSSPLIQRAADYMVTRLVKEHPGRSFVFVVDGDRKGIYAGTTPLPRPEFDVLKRAARPYASVHFIDLEAVFRNAYRVDHRMFEGTDDHHWNAYGNAVVARALYGYLTAAHLLPATK